MTETVSQGQQPREVIYRHKLTTRVTHWVNAVCFTVLLMSGLQILNAHPAIYWGSSGPMPTGPLSNFRPPTMAMNWSG